MTVWNIQPKLFLIFKYILILMKKNFPKLPKILQFIIAFGAIGWFIYRVATKPSRINYPCQRAILSFYLAPIISVVAPSLSFFRSKWLRSGLVLAIIIFAFFASDSFRYQSEQILVNLTKKPLFGLWPKGTTHPPMGVLAATRPRVVFTRLTGTTSWDYSTGYYGDFVDQDKVNQIFDAGLLAFTSSTTPQEAWSKIIPDYSPGKKIAVKVNLNNARDGRSDPENYTNAIIHPVNALVRSLKTYGVEEGNVIIFDAMRYMPDFFVCKSLYAGVQFASYQAKTSCTPSKSIIKATYNSPDPSAIVDFTGPWPNRKVPDLLVNATYVIDMPIFKSHSTYYGVSGAIKNQMGSISGPKADATYDDFHYNGNDQTNNPFWDFYKNPNIKDKTVLIITDAIFGGKDCCNQMKTNPPKFKLFDNRPPEGLFFTADPVANDSIIYDFLTKEAQLQGKSIARTDYLEVFARNGAGVHEHCPYTQACSSIDYQKIDLGAVPNISLTKNASPSSVYSGQTISYTITYHNTVNASATNAKIEDPIPSGTIYVIGSAKLNGATKTDTQDSDEFSFSGTMATWNLGTLNASASGNVSFQVRIN
jgi:uncharacterized repeat protein (TIGR01451 family)